VTKKSHPCSQEFQLVVGSSCPLPVDYRSAPHDRKIPPTRHHCYLQSMFDLLIGLVITLFLFWNIDLYPRFALSFMYNCPSFPPRMHLNVICFRPRVVKVDLSRYVPSIPLVIKLPVSFIFFGTVAQDAARFWSLLITFPTTRRYILLYKQYY
jgi:hypothetical protein